MRDAAVMRDTRYMWLAWAVELHTLERRSATARRRWGASAIENPVLTCQRLMPLAVALLLVVSSRETAQAQGALQEGGWYVVGGDCPKV